MTTRTHRGQGYASEGAVAQDGSLPVYVCNTCGCEVVWATSSRTGRKYLVQVTRGYHDQRFYMKHNAHDCGRRQADQAAAIAAVEADNAERAANRAAAKAMFQALADDPNEHPDVRAKARETLARSYYAESD